MDNVNTYDMLKILVWKSLFEYFVSMQYPMTHSYSATKLLSPFSIFASPIKFKTLQSHYFIVPVVIHNNF